MNTQNSNGKVPLIVFSGGLDSTFLLYLTLLKGNVETMYIEGAQHANKIHMELKVRQEIIKNLERITKNKVITDSVVKVETSVRFTGPNQIFGYGYNRSHWKFQQPHTWLHAIIEYADPNRHSAIQMGYVCGDQMNFHLKQLADIWKSFQDICFQDHEDRIPLEFPLVYLKKHEIMSQIPESILNLIWFCENPTSLPDPCDHCVPCLTHRREKEIYLERVHLK